MPDITSATAFGGSPYASPWDSLPLPGGGTIGKCDTDSPRDGCFPLRDFSRPKWLFSRHYTTRRAPAAPGPIQCQPL
jgi:hypothetical protein